MDKAYAQAEALLGDDGARAARRARVLDAVAREPAASPAEASGPARRPAWRRGGWLVAASVAGVSLYLSIQLYRPTPIPKEPAPTAPAIASSGSAVSPPPAAVAPAPTSQPTPPKFAVAPPGAKPSPRDLAAPAPPPIAPAPEALPAPAMSEMVVTGRRREEAQISRESPQRPPGGSLEEVIISARGTADRNSAASGGPASSPPSKSSAGSPADQASRLRAAAAAGRTAELAALLAAGVPVDAPDAEGETALMKSIQADQPAAAALLRRRGASLDHKNHAGDSARDMASAMDDPELDRALGLDP